MLTFPRIIAHRGASRTAPENTLAAFRAAAVAGATWVEFDVSLTSDGRPVVFHDDSLERTSDGQGLLAETSFEVVKHLDAGSWFGAPFAGEMVPTLEEVLETLATHSLSFNMEIKPDRGREVETAQIALATVADAWPGGPPPILVSSFSRISMATAQEHAPEWPRSLLFDRRPEDWRDAAAALGVLALGANQHHLDADQVGEIKAAGYRLSAYTVNSPERASMLFNWGIDAVFTDDPGLLLKHFSP